MLEWLWLLRRAQEARAQAPPPVAPAERADRLELDLRHAVLARQVASLRPVVERGERVRS